MWIAAARGPLGKMRAVKLMHTIAERRQVVEAMTKMGQRMEQLREMERVADDFQLMSSQRQVSRAFQALHRHVQWRADQR